jgi:two-component system cell cycle response regulator DivK
MNKAQPLSSVSDRAAEKTAGPGDVDSRHTILVVDDNGDVRFMLRFLLEAKGYRMLEAEDGLEAVETARSSRPNLILIDVSLPRLDGLSATRRIREEAGLRTTPIVAVSGHAATEDRDKALAAGCDGYLTKPINFEELYRLIDGLLSAQQIPARLEPIG